MRCTRLIRALTGAAVVATPACTGKSAPSGTTGDAPSVIRYEANLEAGGVAPPAGALKNPHKDAEQSAGAGAGLFASMNCDGCHGGGGTGWAAPSLVDGRWRYGGADEEVFTSIFYGRPKGMPAYGGVIGTDGVWMLVAYLKSQAAPGVVPTTSWLPGGSATPPPAAAPTAVAPAAPAAAESVAPDQMAAKYGCTGCHAVDHKVVGPSIRRSPPSTGARMPRRPWSRRSRMADQGSGARFLCPPTRRCRTRTLQAIVKWILALK